MIKTLNFKYYFERLHKSLLLFGTLMLFVGMVSTAQAQFQCDSNRNGIFDSKTVYGDYDGDRVKDDVNPGPPTTANQFTLTGNLSGGPRVNDNDDEYNRYNSTLGLNSTNSKQVITDYDGDCKMDAVQYDRATATFYIRYSSDPTRLRIEQFGPAGKNPFPLEADYDGDGKADMSVFYYDAESNGQRPLKFEYRYSTTGRVETKTFGFEDRSSGNFFRVVPRSDFNGDGKTDLAAIDIRPNPMDPSNLNVSSG